MVQSLQLPEEGYNIAKEAKIACTDAQCFAKHAVWLAMSDAEKEELATVSPNGDGISRISKQMGRKNQDVAVEDNVRNNAGKLALTDEDKIKAWVEHYDRLLNVEFD